MVGVAVVIGRMIMMVDGGGMRKMGVLKVLVVGGIRTSLEEEGFVFFLECAAVEKWEVWMDVLEVCTQ